jgi:hypothetical protein
VVAGNPPESRRCFVELVGTIQISMSLNAWSIKFVGKLVVPPIDFFRVLEAGPVRVGV